MNQAHYHMLFNHLPIIIPIIGILIMIGGFLTRSEIVKRTAMFLFVLGAIFTFPTFATGEGAEEIVEVYGNNSHHFIHEHEEYAETFALLSYCLGLLSLIGVWANYMKKPFAKIISLAILAIGFATLFFAQKTGTSGGEIRHTEIRNEK
jgi:uncharacterized membrane protein